LGLLICSCGPQKTENNFLNEVPLTKEWMEAYLKQPIPEGARKSRYVDIIKKNKGEYCNLDVEFFTNANDSTSTSRSKTNALGNLAFCYHTPGLPYYKDSLALEILRSA
jgi:hypothetical protein